MPDYPCCAGCGPDVLAHTSAQPVAVTPRQLQILALVANGYTTRQVAQRLGISPATVSTLTGKACQRLGARDRTHAVAIAIRTGVIS